MSHIHADIEQHRCDRRFPSRRDDFRAVAITASAALQACRPIVRRVARSTKRTLVAAAAAQRALCCSRAAHVHTLAGGSCETRNKSSTKVMWDDGDSEIELYTSCPLSLLDLPDDVLLAITFTLLGDHEVISALRPRAACSALAKRLAPASHLAVARRLCWAPAMECTVTSAGRTLTRDVDHRAAPGELHSIGALGSPLPARGRISFTVIVDECRYNWGGLRVGIAVCTQPGIHTAWALSLHNG